MTFFFTALMVFMLARTFLLRRDFLAPDRVYILLYSSLLAVYGLGLSRFQHPWNQWTHFAFWGASACFLGGVLWSRLLFGAANPGRKLNAIETTVALQTDARSIDWTWFQWVYYACACIFFAAFVYAWMRVGFIPAFAPKPDSARLEFLSSSEVIEKGWFFGIVALMLLTEIVLYGGLSLRRMAPALATGVAVLFFYLTLLTRLDLFRLLLFAVVHFHYGRKRLTFRLLLVVGAVAAAIFLAAMLVRVETVAMETFTQFVKTRIPKQYMVFANPYAYVVSNFWNLDYAFERYIDGTGYYPRTYGLDMLKPLLYFLRVELDIGGMLGMDTPYNESIVKVGGLNTVVYPWHFYKDFGWFGVFGLSLGAGLIAGMVYIRSLCRPTLLMTGVYSVVFGFIMLSFMSPTWSFWFVYMNLAVYLIAHRKVNSLPAPSVTTTEQLQRDKECSWPRTGG